MQSTLALVLSCPLPRLLAAAVLRRSNVSSSTWASTSRPTTQHPARSWHQARATSHRRAHMRRGRRIPWRRWVTCICGVRFMGKLCRPGRRWPALPCSAHIKYIARGAKGCHVDIVVPISQSGTWLAPWTLLFRDCILCGVLHSTVRFATLFVDTDLSGCPLSPRPALQSSTALLCTESIILNSS